MNKWQDLTDMEVNQGVLASVLLSHAFDHNLVFRVLESPFRALQVRVESWGSLDVILTYQQRILDPCS